ncbi:sorbitol dehydrogenase-like [Mercenaria mercenaria]|uniref:sorbitol dehydrogenase-like n=1 Tax=Mercenaria mercenaria TaxID=6596 RepID=UPI001E1E183B|nr:sorbitol dehydrogenase-like [Mercenaria mercenaria]
MSDKNLKAILYQQGDIRLEDSDIPEPGMGQVQICVQHVGICGSDIRYWQEGAIGDNVLKMPCTLGHECSGIVSKVGRSVASLKVGDRVAVEPIISCKLCKNCKSGRYNLCSEIKFSGFPPTHGSLARYIVHSAPSCYKLPDHVSTEEGALLEPLSVGVHACRRAGVKLGSKVLICGAGPLGLLTMLTAKACGAAKVCITDLDERRLNMAKQLGVDFALKVNYKEPKEIAELVEQYFGERAEITIECSGAPSCARTAIYATRSGGCVALVGVGPSDITLPILDAAVREIDIRGVMGYANCYSTALEMVASGQVDVKPIITHIFGLEETMKAFRSAITGEGIKIIIKCSRI